GAVVAECRDREPEARVARGGAFEGGQDAARRAVEAADRSRPTPAAGRADQEVGASGGDRRTEGRGREALAEHRLEPRGEQVGRTPSTSPASSPGAPTSTRAPTAATAVPK